MKSRLSSLRQNLTVEIVDIESSPESSRLKSLGFVEGTELKIIKTGNPVLVKISNTSIGLSKELANSILVSEPSYLK